MRWTACDSTLVNLGVRKNAGASRARPGAPTKDPGAALQRRQERQHPVLVGRRQRVEVGPGRGGLARVARDRVLEAEAETVVHEPAPGPQAPERGGADPVARGGAAVLHDPVTGADVVQQEVAERMDDLVA